MTTLFPQIKRVDEDETSKIIKNVLFNSQETNKLEKILNELTNLTEELSYSDDDDVSDSEGTNSNSDDDDDDGNTSDDSEDTPPRGPTSWNLDQFINSQPRPQSHPRSPTPPHLAPASKSPSVSPQPPSVPAQKLKSPTPSPPPRPPPQSSLSQPKPRPEPKLLPKSGPKLVIPKLVAKLEPKREPEPVPERVPTIKSEPILEPEPEPRLQSKHDQKLQSRTSTSQFLLQPQPYSQTHPHLQSNHINQNHLKHSQPADSCIVQIDLSKLKRIPTTKAPTPTMTGSKSIQTAKALKHEADNEKDKTKQAIKYLEASMHFLLHGQEMEDEKRELTYYHEIVPLFKHVHKLSSDCYTPDNPDNMTNLKILALTHKCLGILHTKLYKFKERDLVELAKLTSSRQNGSPIQQADELLIGVKPNVLSAFRRQIAIYENLKSAHDNWHKAEWYCDQNPALKIFFSIIESNCGPLAMMSPFSKLMDHVQCGLKLLRTS